MKTFTTCGPCGDDVISGQGPRALVRRVESDSDGWPENDE